MKARVKTTGEIVTIIGTDGICLTDENGNYHLIRNLEGCEAMPDYWDKLKHQLAGMAMQGILSNPQLIGLYEDDCAAQCLRYAKALVNKLKEEQK